jgi:hypothetical protein
MMPHTGDGDVSVPEAMAQAPLELLTSRLRRLGEGVGKVVYASEHWVVKRERSPSEVVALIVLWNALRRLQRVLPRRMTERLLRGPSRQIRALRVVVQAIMLVLPKSVWFTTHIRETWSLYYKRDRRGQRLAEAHLTGTSFVPRTITFPAVRLKVRGWPGWLVVSEATERVESTLSSRLGELADAGRFDEVMNWLNRFLELRQSAWQRGLFSVDAHFKNFGICADRIVLLDTGGLTNRWRDIEKRLEFEAVVAQPHIQLGLGPLLAERPDIAEQFNSKWKAIVNPAIVRHHWPSDPGGAVA